MNEYERATVNQEFKGFFSHFEKKGCGNYHRASTEMNFIGEYEEAVFYNSEQNRKLTVCYIEGNGNKAEVLSVFIENEVGDSFSIAEYLKEKSIPNDLIEALVIGNYLGSLSDRLKSCLKSYIGVIDDFLGAIVFEGEWEAVPIDWGDYK